MAVIGGTPNKVMKLKLINLLSDPTIKIDYFQVEKQRRDITMTSDPERKYLDGGMNITIQCHVKEPKKPAGTSKGTEGSDSK